MADEELGGTAVVEAPVTEAAPKAVESVDQNAPAEIVEIAGEKVSIGGGRPRDESGKFVKKDGDAPVAADPEVKPTEAPVVATAPDKAILDRAFKAGMTPYEASRLGDRLEGELNRREAARAPAPTQPATVAAPAAQTQTQPAALTPSPIDAALAKLAEYDPAIHELLAPALQQQAEETRKLQEALKTEVGGLQEKLEQERARLQREADFAKSVELDKAIAEWGDEYVSALGKGSGEAIADTPYVSARDKLFGLTEFAAQFHPDKSGAERAKLARDFLFPDIHQRSVQRETYEAARESAKQRGFSGAAATVRGDAAHAGPASESPTVQQFIADVERQNSLEGR
jgi:hypothetical protein